MKPKINKKDFRLRRKWVTIDDSENTEKKVEDIGTHYPMLNAHRPYPSSGKNPV
jgi:hypothetical protein